MRQRRRLLLLAALAGAGLIGCGGGGGGGSSDAGVTLDGGADAGTGDAGVPPLTLRSGPSLPAPTEVLGASRGIPSDVVDASFDAAGNLWAVSSSRLLVRRHGFGAFESFDVGDGLKGEEILSVSGGLAGVAWVGYRGEGDDVNDPEWMRLSGGTSRVVLSGADITVRHFNLVAPPGLYPQYPDGRSKTRTCYRAYATKSGRYAGDAWFGCNHGAGMVNARELVWEHHHPAFCDWDPVAQHCTLRTGDVPAVAHTANGDVWFGGTYGVMKLEYDDGARGNFWGPEPVRNTRLWASPLAPNRFGSEDISGLAVARDGSLWAASRHSGLARRHDDGSVEIYQEAEGLPSNRLEDLAVDGDDGLWLATREGGIARIDLSSGEVSRAAGLPSQLARRVVFERTAAGDFVVAVVRGAVVVWRR